MKNLYFIILFVFDVPLVAFSQPGSVNDSPIFDDGIYVTYEDFKNNDPSIKFQQLTEESKNDLHPHDNRMEIGRINQLTYHQNNEIQKLKTKNIWGICINGEPYIAKDMSVLPPRKIHFFKIVTVGQLSRYFTVETNAPIGSILNSTDKALSNNIPSRYVVKEFIIDFRTGKIMDLKKDFRKLKKLIKKDTYFSNIKIRKKDTDVLISLYNKRNPISF